MNPDQVITALPMEVAGGGSPPMCSAFCAARSLGTTGTGPPPVRPRTDRTKRLVLLLAGS